MKRTHVLVIYCLSKSMSYVAIQNQAAGMIHVIKADLSVLCKNRRSYLYGQRHIVWTSQFLRPFWPFVSSLNTQ